MKYLLATLFALLVSSNTIAAPVVVENCGEELVIDKIPQRMVVHDINMAQMAFALGLQDHIIGLTGISGWYKTNPEFEMQRGDIVELAPKYPTLENLVAVSPDLFFAGWYYGMKPGGDVTPDTLAPHGIQTLILSESCVHLNKNRPAASLNQMYDDILRLGVIFDKRLQAEELISKWKSQVSNIQNHVSGRTTKRVFLYDSGEDKPFTAGKSAMATAMINAAGGINVAADLNTSWGTISWEAIAAANPEFLILLDYQNGGGADDLLAFLQSHPVMKETDAVKNKRFVALRYEELTPGPANISAIDKIAKAMHPDAF